MVPALTTKKFFIFTCHFYYFYEHYPTGDWIIHEKKGHKIVTTNALYGKLPCRFGNLG